MIKKINYKIAFFRWLFIILAVWVGLLALVSWIDLLFYGLPTGMEGWAPLIANTLIAAMLVRVCMMNWDTNIYNHYMDDS